MRDRIGWDMLFLLMMEDMMRSANRDIEGLEVMLDELDENLKGIAMNGQGIGINFEEIRKAEKMYEKESS
tara:strand:- start:34 stop:243 length:210 start_codon:yes stop_codon:yes gene_type:complete